jgi:hypothetical protein
MLSILGSGLEEEGRRNERDFEGIARWRDSWSWLITSRNL